MEDTNFTLDVANLISTVIMTAQLELWLFSSNYDIMIMIVKSLWKIGQ